MTILELCGNNARKRIALNPEFRRIFGRNLDKKLWDNLTGFDVVAFDAMIKPVDGESTMDAVRSRYGDAAVRLIEHLLED